MKDYSRSEIGLTPEGAIQVWCLLCDKEICLIKNLPELAEQILQTGCGRHPHNQMSVKCKGCDGSVDYWPMARVRLEKSEHYHSAGPALTHDLYLPCDWFINTRAVEIVAYVEGERAKLHNEYTLACPSCERPFTADVNVCPYCDIATKSYTLVLAERNEKSNAVAGVGSK